MGQNDLYFYITIKDGSRTIYNKRFPNSGDYGGHNVINPNLTFPVEIIPTLHTISWFVSAIFVFILLYVFIKNQLKDLSQLE